MNTQVHESKIVIKSRSKLYATGDSEESAIEMAQENLDVIVIGAEKEREVEKLKDELKIKDQELKEKDAKTKKELEARCDE